MSITFFVAGKPQSQGSKNWTPNGMKEFNEDSLRPWRVAITAEAVAEMRRTGFETLTGAVYVTVDFLYIRPKSHFGTGRNAAILKPSAPLFKPTMPDIDKLTRAVLDSLTNATVFKDDAQVVHLNATKVYDEYQQGARIQVGEVKQ